jgi:hypothetical protein
VTRRSLSTTVAGVICGVLLFGSTNHSGSRFAEAEEESDLARVLKATSLRCTFTTGVATSFEPTRPRIEQFVTDTRPQPGPGGAVVRASDPVYFDSIDYRAQTARLIAQLGTATVTAYATPAGVYFVDRPALGGVVLYFVFSRVISNSVASLGEFIVVSTMHVGVPSLDPTKGGRWVRVPLIEQSYGTCKVWQ